MAQKPKAFFVTHGEVDASMELAGELQRRIGTAAYIPQYGDSVNISGSEWQVTEAAVASDVPEVKIWSALICSTAPKLSRLLHATAEKLKIYAKNLKKLKNMLTICCHRCKFISI